MMDHVAPSPREAAFARSRLLTIKFIIGYMLRYWPRHLGRTKLRQIDWRGVPRTDQTRAVIRIACDGARPATSGMCRRPRHALIECCLIPSRFCSRNLFDQFEYRLPLTNEDRSMSGAENEAKAEDNLVPWSAAGCRMQLHPNTSRVHCPQSRAHPYTCKGSLHADDSMINEACSWAPHFRSSCGKVPCAQVCSVMRMCVEIYAVVGNHNSSSPVNAT